MEDISLPHDTRVEDILADYFTKKIEGKDAEAKEKHSDSQHSSKSKKSKKRKHKKKKKHKSRKAHSENEEEERVHSSTDDCWVEVTADKDKENSAKDKSDTTDKEPKKKQKSKSKRRDTSASSNVDAAVMQDELSKDKGGTCKDENPGGKSDTEQKEPATKDDVKQAKRTGRTSRRSNEQTKQDRASDKESSVDGGKNQVVLYGPFEEEEASLDEEPSPDRVESTTKPSQPETGSGAAGKNEKSQPANNSLEEVPLPAEPAAQSEDTQLEDMDISDSLSSGGELEAEDCLSQSLPSDERCSSPSITSRHQTETKALQECVPLQKAPTSEETLAKGAPARAAIPWTYAELQPPPPPPWLKPEVTKPVGQVRPFVREVNTSESAAQKGLLQGRQDGVGAVGSVATVQPSADPPLIAPDKSTNKAEELSALPSPATKAAQQSAFHDVSAKLTPQISLATVLPPPVNVHSGALYSATVMPVHVPYQFTGLPGHGQVGPGVTLPVPQEKSAHMNEQQHDQHPPQPQKGRGNQSSDSVDSTGTASQLSGPPGSESNPPSPTKKPEVASTAPRVGAAEEAMDGNESECSSRSSSPAEGRSRSSSKERVGSRSSRSRSPNQATTKRSRSSESPSPSSDIKKLRKDDRADPEEKSTKKECCDRRDSASPARKRSGSRSRRSRSHDQTKRRSQSRERVRQRRSQSKGRDSSRRKSRDRETPRAGLILKRYKNELSSEYDSSPERKSKAKPSSPVKKKPRRGSDADSVSSQDDKPEDNRAASPMSETDEPDADDKGEDRTHDEKEKELEKQRPSETEGEDKDAPYGPLPPNEARTSPAHKEAQHSHDEMDDERDLPAGSDISSSLGTKADNKSLHTPVVSSSSSKESFLAGDMLLASTKGQSGGNGSLMDMTVCKSLEPQQDRQDRSTSKGDKMIYEKLTVPSGESAVSSSTGSPGLPEERPTSTRLSGDLNTENKSGANSSSVRGPSACSDSYDDGEKKPSTTTGDKAKETSYSDDTRSTSDNGRGEALTGRAQVEAETGEGAERGGLVAGAVHDEAGAEPWSCSASVVPNGCERRAEVLGREV
ncbi:hypothetical protein HPB51_022027 [Rhipicephalus microplus]|uniref:Uncharacterized protein n=1 Tax=Rhipicephalus microplus TaxID=6941 RepID=A0A9J6DJS4_RHIMP|nr:hypothetical protein HPB51_022027 [Rhipicephalus microplus]